MLGVTFANEHEVGWDTTVKLLAVPDATPIQELMYDITVRAASGSVVFRTKRLISDIGARSIRGRGTRVWEAIKVADGAASGEHSVALKDSWVDADRMREADILEKLKLADTSELFRFVTENGMIGTKCYGDRSFSANAYKWTITLHPIWFHLPPQDHLHRCRFIRRFVFRTYCRTAAGEDGHQETNSRRTWKARRVPRQATS